MPVDEETDAILREVLPDHILGDIAHNLSGANVARDPWHAIGECVAFTLRNLIIREIGRREIARNNPVAK